MEYTGRTPNEAIECAKKWIGITHSNRTDLQGGTFYAMEHPNNHPMRRFKAGYIKGACEERVKRNCITVDGVLVVKNNIHISSWTDWN